MDKQRKSSLTTFNFELPEDTSTQEGVLSKIFDKVLNAVSGSTVHDPARHSIKTSNLGQPEREHSLSSIPIIVEKPPQLPDSISANSSLSKHLTSTSSSSTATSSITNKELSLHNFPATMHLDTNSAVVPRPSTSTTATNTTTVTVGNQKSSRSVSPAPIINESTEKTASINHPANTVQFAAPTTSNNTSSNRKSQDQDALEYLLSSPLNHRRSIDSDTQSVVTNFSISNSNSLSRILARLRGHKSDKEFWMPDEQCKECYKCRKPFTLLRRKHHCRTCGQIFCGRCASHVISGKMFKQKGQVRVCNFCYAEQLRQYHLIKDTLSNTHTTINAGSASINDSSKPDYISSMATSNTTKTKTDLLQLQPVDQNENTYSSPIIPSQKAPLAAPQMQIPTTALKQARSTYGNDDTTTFALEIPIRSSDSFMKAGSPQLPAFIERPHSFNAYHDNDTNLDSPGNVIPAITTTGASHSDLTATGGLKRLFDAGTSLLKSSASSRPRSNTSSSAPLEDTRYAQSHHQSPFSPYALDRGGGTVLAESELSPYPGTNPTSIDLFQDQLHDHHHPSYLNNNNNNNNNDRYQQHQNSSCTVPTATTSSPPIIFSTIQTPPSKGSHLFHPPHQSYSHRPELILPSSSHILPNTMIGSDNESYDHRLRLKRTEELRGQNLPCSASASGHPSFSSPRRLSLTGSSSSGGGGNLLKTSNGTASKKSSRSSKIRINTIGLPKSTNHYDFNENLSPNPLVSPFLMEDMNKPIDSLTLSRLRLPPRTRRQSSSTAGLPQTVELSLSARTHARKMLKQLMEDITIANHSKEEWEEVIMQLLLKVTNHVQPDIRAGDVMDVRHYVKVKKIPGGLPSDSFYVKGIVCTKNVAHKRMVRNISHPRILILMFSLDYSRVEMENQLLSIAPVISQEREHIRKLVGRIVALKPSLLLVKSTVSRLALEFLLEANIPVVHNVKHSVIEAVARCTQASIVTSVDKLQHGLSFGRCGSFEIRTILHEWIPNRRKTFLVFDDCAPELGGTIVLRGEKLETLRVIKRLIDFMVFVVNNLKLETSLLLDSFAKSRGSTELDSDTFERNRSPLIQTTTATATSINNKSNKHCSESMISTTTSQHEYNDDDAQTVNSHYINDLLSLYQNTILSVSQFVVFSPPYLLLVLKETEDKLALIHQQKRRKSVSGSSIMTNTTSINFKEANTIPNSVSPTRSTFEKQSIIDQHYHMPCEEDGAILDAEYDLIAKSRQVSRAWETYTGENPGSISPFYHQNIVVLYSSVCTVTTVPCQGPEIRMFGFYRLPSDITLGQYVMDFCNDARQPCSSFMCDHPMMQHYRSYAHGNARINVMIEPFPCPLSGMSYKLLMWSYCKLCDKPTPVLPMSENTWNYSFGKFLETFLYQRGVHCRADICPHDMARNHVRYFGYKDMTVRFQYDPIELLEVATPPMKLFIQSQVQMDLKEEELKSLRSKINKFYQSIIERNKAFPFDLVDPHKLEACKAELQDMSLEAQGEKKDALQLVQNVYATSDPLDTLTIQVVRRNLFQVLAHWGAVYADFVQYYLQPERELKKITTNQLRKMFPADMSDTSLFNHMDNERTKRATEVTDLPLLGIGLDDEDDDALIGHIMKRKTAATKSNEIKAKAANNQMLMPFLSTTPSANLPALWNPAESNHTMDSFKFDLVPQQQVDSDHKNSFLRPERRRRLSLDLLHKLDEKFKATEENQRNVIGGLISLNRMTSNKFLRAKSPGALSATFTPSRIPILRQHQQRHSSPTLYEPFQHHQRNSISAYVDSTSTPTHLDPRYLDYHRNSHNNHKKGKHIERRGSIINTQGNDSSSNGSDKQLIRTTFENSHSKHKRRNRHHSISHNQHVQPNRFEVNDDDNDAEDENSTGHSAFLKRSAASRGDRRLRSRLPRKKTYIQVYTHANELVTEDIDDEFAEGNVHMHLAREDAMRLHLSASKKRKYHSGDSNYYSGGRRRDTYAPKPLLSRFYQDNGIDADNDDNDLSGDSSDGSDKNSNRNSNLDYFSSFAPYAHQVMEQGKLPEGITAKREQRRKSLLPSNAVSKTRSANSTSQQYPIARSYFPFSDGQMDMSSGLSGDDENERDLPLASDLLKIQQSSASIEDNTNLDHLPNIVPDIIVDGVEDLTTSNALTAESSDDIRHSAEKISFMKTLTNFLTDSGVGNLLPLESPLQPTEYLFPDSYVVVREDEPSTIIAYTLSCDDYIDKMHDIQDCSSDNASNDGTIKPGDASFMNSIAPSEVNTLDNLGNANQSQQAADDIQETLLRESGTHMRYNFSTGSTKFFCKIFFSEQFDALRRNCGCDESYILSLANCIKWDSSGGKSGSAFLKTKDDRLLMKQMSKYELDAFLGFAPAYFQYMSEAFFSELPTVLAKIFGFYSIGYKNSASGKSMRMDVLVMENLFYQRTVKKIFDLKGSMRNRHVQSTGKQDEVLLDENLVELIYQSPLFIRAHSKEILRSSLHNDTLFLSNRNVMDYSLLVGIDEERQELVVGIVDFIRTFTWDKKLESWVKETGILGGGGKGPTIVSPRQYRIRFREAMERYFLMVPDFWALTRQNRVPYSTLHHHPTISKLDEEL